MVVRRALASLLVLLLAVPAWADPAVVGVTTNSQSAMLGDSPLVPGTTVLSGQVITVGPRGGVWIALAGGGRLYMGASSELRLSQVSGRIEMELLRGDAAFRFSEEPIRGRMADATFRSANNQPAVAVLDLLDSKSAVITAETGALLVGVARNARSLILHEGASLKLAPDSANPQRAPRSGASHSLRGILVTAFVIGGVATAIGFLLGQSETQQSATTKANAVQPFRFP